MTIHVYDLFRKKKQSHVIRCREERPLQAGRQCEAVVKVSEIIRQWMHKTSHHSLSHTHGLWQDCLSHRIYRLYKHCGWFHSHLRILTYTFCVLYTKWFHVECCQAETRTRPGSVPPAQHSHALKGVTRSWACLPKVGTKHCLHM